MTVPPTPAYSLIRAPAACVTCGYNLLGLPILGNCPECGTAAARTVPPCPRCRTVGIARPLLSGTTEKHRLWRCEGCFGLGFEKGRFAKEVRASTAAPALKPPAQDLAMNPHAPVECGACAISMTSACADSQIMIDRCDTCGFLWLDAGEFEAVTAYIARLGGTQGFTERGEQVLADRRALLASLRSESPDWTVALLIEGVLEAACWLA
jgi:Zn-finger nucleic acid-binding protein